jgi:ribonuclease P protein component
MGAGWRPNGYAGPLSRGSPVTTEGDPRASRRRGPGEDSTGPITVARRFRYTPREYRCTTVVARGSGPGRPALAGPQAVCEAVRRGPSEFDTRKRARLSSARRRTRRGAPGRRARLRASRVGPNGDPRSTERITDSPHGQADVPAQEAPSRQGARLPRPDEDAGRTTHPGGAPGPRSEAPVGLTDRRGPSRPRAVMLSRPQDFAALGDRGTTRSHPLLTARFLRTDLETTRFGLSTGRRLGGAVVRNRVRRRLREALRVMAPSFQPGWDVLIIARPAIVEADHDALVGALRRLLVRGGVLGGRTST